jgi:hypothetical protein
MKNLFAELAKSVGVIVSKKNDGPLYKGADPAIQFGCKSATFYAGRRKVIVEEVKQFGSCGGSGWIGSISIEGDKLILEFPSDAEYEIFIEGQGEFQLPKSEVEAME